MISTNNKSQNMLDSLKKFRFEKKTDSQVSETGSNNTESVSSEVHTISDSESNDSVQQNNQDSNSPNCESLKKENEAEEEEEEEKASFLKIESVRTISSVHSVSDSDSQDSIIRRKDNRISPAIVSDSEEEENEPIKKYSRIKTMNSGQSKKKSVKSSAREKSENGIKKRKASTLEEKSEKKKVCDGSEQQTKGFEGGENEPKIAKIFPPNIKAVYTSVIKLNVQYTAKCKVCGSVDHSELQCSYKNYKCNNCLTLGHLAKVCIKPKVEEPIKDKSKEEKSKMTMKSRKEKSTEWKHRNKKAKKAKKEINDEDVDTWSDNVYDSDADSDVEVSNYMTGTKKKVFEFLNTATTVELLSVPSCTQNRVNNIIEARPFSGWRDMVQKLESGKNMGAQILNLALDVLKTRTIVSKLMEKCLKLAISTEEAIAAGSTRLKEQPSLLCPELRLKSYQMVGLNWLAVMHSQDLSGILADEMGLGKTIQVISFLAYLKETGESNYPHLIVVPATTLENWAVEFTRWCPSLRVVVYHGSPDERRALRVMWFKEKFKSMDVIITTYNIIGTNYEEKKMFKIINLDYVVFDEAHMLKNMNTQRYAHLFNINAKRRILLTGTPLQNNLLELMSLLNFVMPNMFADKIQYIKTFFSKNSKLPVENLPQFEQKQVELAKRIMKPFVLRRLKQDVLQDLPKKTSALITCPLEEKQKIKYDEYLQEIKYCAENDRENYNYMSSFMQLRKLANHPLACRYLFQDEQLKDMAERLSFDYNYKGDNKEHIHEDLMYMSDYEIHQLTEEYRCISKFKLEDRIICESGKLKKLDELLPKLKEEGHRVLIFSQFVFILDILEQYLKIRDHDYLRLDGSTRSLDRQELIDNYNEDSNIFIFLLTTKAGGIGINLTTADTVIIHDIDFNPYNDKQAEDRCHRLGQQKPVHIMRLISEGTVEEYIYKKAQEKLHLEQELIATEEESEEKKNVEDLLKEALGIQT
ncbi:unnamed protein product [Nezara viridula]|uniref:SWI/SNF-related matrix-associated actin-dependent regulator of chromatin subfamily A containing DEAD/H box 1 homolog n=1 Tax=Nezara viridula TaxID=85310 RepID=A0A9P0EDX2_NEZVI|nr:unnamed protein product [Nezara viridula]